jgi:hypothetical protein
MAISNSGIQMLTMHSSGNSRGPTRRGSEVSVRRRSAAGLGRQSRSHSERITSPTKSPRSPRWLSADDLPPPSAGPATSIEQILAATSARVPPVKTRTCYIDAWFGFLAWRMPSRSLIRSPLTTDEHFQCSWRDPPTMVRPEPKMADSLDPSERHAR